MKYKGSKKQVPTFHAGKQEMQQEDQLPALLPKAAGMPGDAGRDKSLSPACTCDLRSWQEPRGPGEGLGVVLRITE